MTAEERTPDALPGEGSGEALGEGGGGAQWTVPPAGAVAASPGAPPFGPGFTLLAGILIVGGYFLLQTLLIILAGVAVVAVGSAAEPSATEAGAAAGAVATQNLLMGRIGLLFWISTLVAAPLGTAAVLAVTWQGVKHRPAPRRELRQALGLVMPRLRHVVGWLAATAAVLSGYELLAVWLDRPEMPEFVEQLATTAGWFPGLIFAVVVLAPLFEEMVFRGFLIPGLAAGRAGVAGAVLVSAVLFAATHGGQYDLFDLSFVLALGLVFALCRVHTGSTWLCILLHAAVNALAAWQFVELAGG